MISKFNSSNTVLIPYNCIVDEDSGLLRVIRDYYSNDTVFDLEKFDTDEKIEDLILNKKYVNPLDLVIRPEYTKKSLDFYNQFIEEEYENILKNSFMTTLFKFVLSVKQSQIGRVIFLANNEREKQSIELLFGSDNNILIGKIDEINLDDIDTIFIKRISDIRNFNNINGKNLYILDYNFNFETDKFDDNPLPLITFAIMASEYHNVVYLISPYNHEKENKENDDF